MESPSKKRKNDSSSDESDSSCRIVAFLGNAGHTLTGSDEDTSPEKPKHKQLKKRKILDVSFKITPESSDSSVEITDVKLPNQAEIDALLARDTQELDDKEMWERLCRREELKEQENEETSK